MKEPSRKSKSRFVSGTALVKWHAVIYISVLVALWAVLAATLFGSPSDSVFALNRNLITSHVWLTICWGLVFLAHFVFQEVRVWRQGRERASHLKVVDQIQERYGSRARLDLEAEAEDGILIDEDEWIAQRSQSK